MFSEDDEFRLTSEERRGVDLLRLARSGKIINHYDLKFKPLGVIEPRMPHSYGSSSLEKDSPERLDGRWLADWTQGNNQMHTFDSQKAVKSRLDTNVEDAKIRRLR